MADKIACKELVRDFQLMYVDRDGYIAGTSGEIWTAEKQAKTADAMAKKYGEKWIGHRVEDCSGAFVRAYRAHGKSIYHGSNRIARKHVEKLLPPSEAKPGMAAFKARKPGERYYDLPSQYKPGGSQYNGDLNDYYHIGLVDTDPKYVLNSQSTQTGFQRSRLEDGWDCVACLKEVDYGEEGTDTDMGYLYEAIVDSANDKPVNLRKGPGTSYAVVAAVKDGTRVKVLSEADDDWAEIDTGSKTGYMMRGFLVKAEDAPGTDAKGGDTLADALRQIIDIAQKALREGGY